MPSSGYAIGNGYEVLVLYASPHRITLKYTREDNAKYGYTLHVDGIRVEPSRLSVALGRIKSGLRSGIVEPSWIRVRVRIGGRDDDE